MAIDNKKLAESLKILAQNPGKIKAQQNLYKDRLAEIRRKEETGNYARNTLEREKAEALASRDRVCHTLAHSMREALNYVAQNNDYSVHAIDLDNKKLQTALSMVNLMGSNMSFSDQLGVINQFKGDPASLRVLEAAFQKLGQSWAAKTAAEMQKPVSNKAIEEMSGEIADLLICEGGSTAPKVGFEISTCINICKQEDRPCALPSSTTSPAIGTISPLSSLAGRRIGTQP